MHAIDFNGKIYGEGSANARDSVYDNSNSTLSSTNVNDALDEVDGKVETKAAKSNLSEYILTGTKSSSALSEGTFFVDKDGALRVATDAISTSTDVSNSNSAVKTVGEVLTELNSKTAFDIMKSTNQILNAANQEVSFDGTLSDYNYIIFDILANGAHTSYQVVPVINDIMYLRLSMFANQSAYATILLNFSISTNKITTVDSPSLATYSSVGISSIVGYRII